jgi:phospholipid/cholesterol/gamma-HCH transport system ATP-binding protein
MIEICDLYKSFAGKPVLKGTRLIICSDETTTIIGGSGCGKSVLFKHIIGLMKPDSGEIRVDGRDITRLKERDLLAEVSRFAMVFQGGALFDSLTVGENVAFGLTHGRRPSAEIKRRVEASLSQVGLPGIAHLMPAELSGGMRKRVAIARAIIKEPHIIMYDEPTTGLDPIMSDVISELILKVGKNAGITSIVITHDMTSAYKISDKIAVLVDGRIVEEGRPDDIRHTENPVVRQFIEGRADGPISIR